MGEEKTKGLGLKEWIFCIGTILVLTLFMVLPPVFRIVFVDEAEKRNPEPIITPTPTNNPTKPDTKLEFDDSTYEKEICTKNVDSASPYIESVQMIFSHKEKNLKMYTETSIKVYDLLDGEQIELFEQEKSKCEYPPASYFHIKGYQYSCKTEENKIEATEKFNLETFSNTTIEEDGKLKVVSVLYFYNQNVDIIKAGLESQGYTCETISTE